MGEPERQLPEAELLGIQPSPLALLDPLPESVASEVIEEPPHGFPVPHAQDAADDQIAVAFPAELKKLVVPEQRLEVPRNPVWDTGGWTNGRQIRPLIGDFGYP